MEGDGSIREGKLMIPISSVEPVTLIPQRFRPRNHHVATLLKFHVIVAEGALSTLSISDF